MKVLLGGCLLAILLYSSHAQQVWPELQLKPLAKGFSKPVDIQDLPDGTTSRIFVVEQKGIIREIQSGHPAEVPFLAIEDKLICKWERGLLGLAFPPGYAQKQYFYVNYTRKPDGATIVARYRLKSDGLADRESEEVILMIPQPYDNHNGGQIVFGPDGFLYIGMGDGGSGGDPHQNGQSPKTLLGKMLRIDVESGKRPYGIPENNPFAGREDFLPEIWAYGLRNPWRFGFDRVTGDLFIADVGQNKWEEVHFQPSTSKGGENYGWRIREGMHDFKVPAEGRPANLVEPVAEYSRDQGISITGGKVYRGTRFPALEGIYFYADYGSGRIWGLKRINDVWISKELMDTEFNISTFGEDKEGNLYVGDYASGTIFSLEPRL
jgi:glucose/arabinose dehydrogenase